ncbi:MAG TPA: peptide-methionine (S)-S-oxide reductase MsrA [Patescibacteria group bacterium]|nr:peptide-methionine (S)-S-oxide reductase MsrA [Patescibacteria group bacterium]
METAVFGGGCFWCTEALFKNLKGVISVIPGYSGGDVKNPSYEEVSSGKTGHVESAKIEFDPKIISYEDLLYVFMKTHDPTQEDGQGADIGPQYQSTIFYLDNIQKDESEKIINKLQTDYDKKIATKLIQYKNFYKAEDYHKNYYENHKNAAYCKLVIDPKIVKLRQNFADMLK